MLSSMSIGSNSALLEGNSVVSLIGLIGWETEYTEIQTDSS